jgi:hypothetical protein
MTSADRVVLFSGRPASVGAYVAALRVMRSVRPELRSVLRDQVRRTVFSRINHHIVWFGRGRRWSGGAS